MEPEGAHLVEDGGAGPAELRGAAWAEPWPSMPDCRGQPLARLPGAERGERILDWWAGSRVPIG